MTEERDEHLCEVFIQAIDHPESYQCVNVIAHDGNPFDVPDEPMWSVVKR